MLGGTRWSSLAFLLEEDGGARGHCGRGENGLGDHGRRDQSPMEITLPVSKTLMAIAHASLLISERRSIRP